MNAPTRTPVPVPPNPLIGSFPDDTLHACQSLVGVLACLGEFEDTALLDGQHGIWRIAKMINDALAYELAAQRRWAIGDKEVES